MTNPEDMIFRTVFSDPRMASPLLCQALPPQIARTIDWRTVTAAPPAMVTRGVLPTGPHTDLLFTATARDSDQVIYLLLERRLGSTHWAVFEVLQVAVRILERFVDLHPKRALPPLLPVVVHHGPHPWDAPKSFREYYDLDGMSPDVRAALDPYLLSFEILLYDLAAMSEAEQLWRLQGGTGTWRG